MSTNQSICMTCPAWPKSLFKSLNEVQLEQLSTTKKICQYKKNDTLFEQNEKVTGIYCNADGLLKIIQTDNNNKIKFSRLVYPGDSAGHRSIFIEDTYKGSASVVSDSINTCFIDKENILALFSYNNEFAKNLITKISNELDRTVKEQIETKERSVFSRLCSLLLELFDHFSETDATGTTSLTLTITKVELARLLSVADETVIRMMTELKNEAVIDSLGKTLVLLSYDKLKKFTLP